MGKYFDVAEFLSSKKDQEMQHSSRSWEKLFVKLSREMHELFPHIPISECYKIIKLKHERNKETKRNILLGSLD